MVLSCFCLAQQERVPPSFRAQTELVIIPFEVRRGSRSISDLKSSDVVLLEDGVPRGFTIFEAPPVHLTLDLAVMFDVTNPAADEKTRRVGFWNADALRELANYWSEAIKRRLLENRGAAIRFSIYRFDQAKLQRLCQSTSDPKVLSEALHGLADPAHQASGQAVDIPLPEGLTLREPARKVLAKGGPAEPWSLTAALSTLRDSMFSSQGADKMTAARAMVIFSTGAEGTSLMPEDLADEAVGASVPIYPVALVNNPSQHILPYEGYGSDGLSYWDLEFKGPSMFGPGGLQRFCRDGTQRPSCYGVSRANYINYPFERLGELTGGLRLEAVYHSPPLDAGEEGPGIVVTGGQAQFSMTGGETNDVLERIKTHALARFRSSYTVGFVPSQSTSPSQHKLEVKLAPKTEGKVTEGKRSATY